MRIGIIGLGKMGGNIARRLLNHGFEVVGFDAKPSTAASLVNEKGFINAGSLEQLINQLSAPRLLWLMLPAGEITEACVARLLPELNASDVIVDGGNTYYRDSQRRAVTAAKHHVDYLDVGVSGGVWGLCNGYCLMIGGARQVAARVEPVFEALAPTPERGWVYCGPSGAGHYAKMVHNGIEYGMMEALAEGMALLRAPSELNLDVGEIAETWREGSVIRSWLLDLAASFLREDPALSDTAPFVADSGEGRWTASEAISRGVPAPVITLALLKRFESQGEGDYASKVLARMRGAFGGHAVQSAVTRQMPQEHPLP